MTDYGTDKMLRAAIVVIRLRNEAAIHISQEGRCVFVKFNPGRNTLKDGLDQETLIFYDETFANSFYDAIKNKTQNEN